LTAIYWEWGRRLQDFLWHLVTHLWYLLCLHLKSSLLVFLPCFWKRFCLCDFAVYLGAVPRENTCSASWLRLEVNIPQVLKSHLHHWPQQLNDSTFLQKCFLFRTPSLDQKDHTQG
jgi:hypothetical protein